MENGGGVNPWKAGRRDHNNSNSSHDQHRRYLPTTYYCTE